MFDKHKIILSCPNNIPKILCERELGEMNCINENRFTENI